MAFYDWNHDGKKDWQDNYIEYNIYKSSTGNGNQSYSSGDGSSFKTVVAVVIFFLMVCGVVNLCTPKCIVDGCNSEREEGSSYCYYHKNSAVYKNHLKHSSRTFVSPNVLGFLIKNYNIAPISTPEDDMREMLGE